MTRNDLIESLWQQAAPLLFITRDQFVEQMGGWDVDGIVIDGHLAFIVAVKGAEFHFASLGTHRLPLHLARDVVKRLVDVYGHATTRTPREDLKQQRFNLLFGFEKVHEDELDIHFRIG